MIKLPNIIAKCKQWGGDRTLSIILLALCYFSFYKLIFNNVTRCRNYGVRFVVSLVTE